MILIGMNQEFALQVSDRRLSWNGAIVEDEHNKSFSLSLPGFRFTVAFTGLAAFKSFRTADWLIDQFFRMGQLAVDPVVLINRLAAALTHRFTTYLDFRDLDSSQKQLTISIVGYNYHQDPPRGLAATVANNEGGEFMAEFSHEIRPLSEPWTWVNAFGNVAALDLKKMEAVRKALRNGLRPEAVSGMFEDHIRAMSDDPRSGVTIGKQLDIIQIFSDPSKPVLSGRSTAIVRPEFTMPAAVMIGPGGEVTAFKGATLAPVDEDTLPLSVPKVHRNQPCPCGSGKRYRDCHRV